MAQLLAGVRPWWPHLLSWPRLLDPVSWMWLSVKGYAFSSSGEQVAILAALIAVYRRHQCAAPWCPLPGRHRTADGQHGLCRRHHPDLPNHRLSLAEIHARHRAHKPKGDDS